MRLVRILLHRPSCYPFPLLLSAGFSHLSPSILSTSLISRLLPFVTIHSFHFSYQQASPICHHPFFPLLLSAGFSHLSPSILSTSLISRLLPFVTIHSFHFSYQQASPICRHPFFPLLLSAGFSHLSPSILSTSLISRLLPFVTIHSFHFSYQQASSICHHPFFPLLPISRLLPFVTIHSFHFSYQQASPIYRHPFFPLLLSAGFSHLSPSILSTSLISRLLPFVAILCLSYIPLYAVLPSKLRSTRFSTAGLPHRCSSDSSISSGDNPM